MPTSPKLPDSGSGGTPPAAGAADIVILGRILGAFGIRGWIRIRPFTEAADGLLSQQRWIIGHDGAGRTVHVEEVKSHGGYVLAQLRGIDDRGQAEALRGADVMVERAQLPEAEAGEYYWTDLIGLAVGNSAGADLGRITGLIAAPAHDVLRVATGAGANGHELLIPFVEPILLRVDLAGGRVTVDWELDY